MISREKAFAKQWLLGGIVAGLAAVAAVAVVVRAKSGAPESTLPGALQVASLKAQAESNPGVLRETIRENMQRDDLSDEQQRELASNVRSVFRTLLTERVEEWYAAESQEEKTAILDRHIDEFQARRQEWDRRRAEREKAGKDDEEESGRERMRRAFASPSKQERKARSESRDPDQSARMMTYFAAVRSRMTERGMQPPVPGPGGRGPWGP